VRDNSLTSALKLLIPGIKERARWEREEKASEMLQELGLEERRDGKLQDQDVGTQKLVELGQIFLLDPSIFLLDEPLAGVSTNKEPLLLDHIKRVKETGKTIIMISHKMESVMNVSDAIIVLLNGKILAGGSPEEIRNNQTVKESYLGVSNVRSE
jgi:branched-chain amino acid transport system ATP-binding protein